MYAYAMARIESQPDGLKRLAMRTLAWIVCTRRPLTTHELQDALAVRKGMESFDNDDLPDMGLVIAVCSGTVTVDEKSNIIRLVHFSAQEYFERHQEHWFPNAHSEIATMSLTYLTLHSKRQGNSARDRQNEKEQSSLHEYAAEHWGYHARLQPSNDMINILKDRSKTASIAKYHVVRCVCYDPCLTGPNDATGLHLAAYVGLEQIARSLIKDGMAVDDTDSHGLTPLSWAAERNDAAITKMLLKLGANIENKDHWARTPLTWAAGHGNKATVEVLINQGARLDIKDNNHYTPSEWATVNSHQHVVGLLLSRGATQTVVDSQVASGIIDWAIGNDQQSILDTLMEEEGADKRAWLLAAARDGHSFLVERLLRENVNPDYRDEPWGRSPISQAAEYDIQMSLSSW